MKVEAETKNSKMEEESKREGEKIMLEWKAVQQSWKKKKQESMPSEGLKGNKGNIQWCKYTVMKRRTESMLDISEKKVHSHQGFMGPSQDRQSVRNEGEKKSQQKSPKKSTGLESYKV